MDSGIVVDIKLPSQRYSGTFISFQHQDTLKSFTNHAQLTYLKNSKVAQTEYLLHNTMFRYSNWKCGDCEESFCVAINEEDPEVEQECVCPRCGSKSVTREADPGQPSP